MSTYANIKIPAIEGKEETLLLFDKHGVSTCGVINGVSIYDAETEDGKFEKLENALVEASIPFDRYSYPEGSTIIRYFRPATSETDAIDVEVEGDVDGEICIEAGRIRHLMKLKPVQFIKEIRRILAEENPLVPELKNWGKPATKYCQACGTEFAIGGDMHDWDAIDNFGICTTCLGICPECGEVKGEAEKRLRELSTVIASETDIDKTYEALVEAYNMGLNISK